METITKEQNITHLYSIYSQRLAGHLMSKGFPLFTLEKDSKSCRNIFIFPSVAGLQEEIDRWKALRNSKNGGANA